jgi:hypothetical protein
MPPGQLTGRPLITVSKENISSRRECIIISLSSDIDSLLVKLENIKNQEITMQKRTLFLVMGLAVLLVVLNACASKATPPPATATPTTPPSPTATATQLVPTETSAISATESATVVDVPSGCSTYTLLPTPDPSAIETFPAIQESDWAQGLETASITIIEYSDFQ